jgi:dienelactone hydrolase
VCHGAVDPFIKPEELAAFLKSMNDGKFDYQFVSYAGAIHAFTNPKADEVAKETGLVGGIGYNASADRRSWAHLRVFFEEIFAVKKG